MRGKLARDACFEFIQALGEVLVGGEHLAQLYEGAYHVGAHLHGSWTVENHYGHDGAVFGEGKRGVAPTTAARL